MTEPALPPTDHTPQPYEGPSFDEVMALRKQYLMPGLVTYYQQPIMLVEGHGQWLFDEQGKRYLDALGGIVTISVGHCHPDVTAAAKAQLDRLQHATTIYLHPNVADYGRALAAKMPGDLKVCYFVNSGSEANDLALLMARLHTGNYDMIALRNAYHGGNAPAMGLTAHSSWKYNCPQGFGVHHARNADPYRGPWGHDDPNAAVKYAEDVADVIRHATPGRVAGFFAESIQGVGGTVVYPEGYLAAVYETVRAAGGVCIADEVQSGFGRTGTHFWGFETQGVTPDIVTMAKGIGNGTPLAAVVTTPAIAKSLEGKIHFNTYGGNPVASAIGKAVLEVIEREQLQRNSLRMGERLLTGLRELQKKHAIIGEVRGLGLMVGLEFVTDRESKAPATEACARIHERAKELGLLLGKGGLYGSVLRIKPPMCITTLDVDFMVEVLDVAIGELT